MVDIEAAQAIDTKTMASFRIEREDWQAFGALAKKERLTVTQVLTDYIERCLAIGRSMYGVSINPDTVGSSLDPLPIDGNLHSAINGRLTAIEHRLDMPSINAEHMAAELAKFARRLESIEQRPALTEDQITTICELTMQGWPPITDEHIRELVRAEVKHQGNNGPKPAPTNTTQAGEAATPEKEHSVKGQSTAPGPDSETLKMVGRLKADPDGLQRWVRAGIAQGLKGKALCEYLSTNGHGANDNAKPFDVSVASRMVKAIEYLNGEGDQPNG
jgi:hypothetical protein